MSNWQSFQINQERNLRRIYMGTVLVIISMYFVVVFYFADPSNFWEHFLNEIGTTKTLLGTPNVPAALIVMSGMFIAGRSLLEAARIYLRTIIYPRKELNTHLLYVGFLGSFISIFLINLGLKIS